jgi:hypothetical protein
MPPPTTTPASARWLADASSWMLLNLRLSHSSRDKTARVEVKLEAFEDQEREVLSDIA